MFVGGRNVSGWSGSCLCTVGPGCTQCGAGGANPFYGGQGGNAIGGGTPNTAGSGGTLGFYGGSGGIAYGGTRLLTPRLGWLAFGAETHYEDRQKVEFFDTIYRPRAIARPTFVTAKVKPDVEGVLRAWVGWLMV